MQNKTIAVIIPCLNEEQTIASVVRDYRAVLPEAEIYVYDNESTDHTAQQAVKAGAKIRFCATPGKGAVLRQAFHEINADIYVLTDGDGTYPPTMVREMIRLYLENPKSIVIGKRKSVKKRAVMSYSHVIGNRFLSAMFRMLYGFENIDILSGSRIMGRDFVKSFPALYDGFETETERALHAWLNHFKVRSVDVPYLKRPQGSQSKIHTVRDGIRIIKLTLTGRKGTVC